MKQHIKGRSRKAADRHYQKVADAEVKRLRQSVPDTQPVIKAVAECAVCGGGLAPFGNLGLTHIGASDHLPVKR